MSSIFIQFHGGESYSACNAARPCLEFEASGDVDLTNGKGWCNGDQKGVFGWNMVRPYVAMSPACLQLDRGTSVHVCTYSQRAEQFMRIIAIYSDVWKGLKLLLWFGMNLGRSKIQPVPKLFTCPFSRMVRNCGNWLWNLFRETSISRIGWARAKVSPSGTCLKWTFINSVRITWAGSLW